MTSESLKTRLAIIGSGMAGIAAAIFAANRGIPLVQVGKASELSFSSGCLDLFNILPGKNPVRFDDPFQGIRRLRQESPAHPYARVSTDEIRQGFAEFTAFMEKAGIPFRCKGSANSRIITPAGTLKHTFCVPSAMIAGSEAVEKGRRILIVDIRGLKGFGARQMAQTLARHHPKVQGVTVRFPGRENAGDLMCERLTWDLETPTICDRFIDTLAPHVADVDAVGLPAILGIYRFEELRHRMETRLGKKVFEIPTLAPSVTGMRTKEAFLGKLPGLGIRHFPVAVEEIRQDANGFSFVVKEGMQTVAVSADALILATGRFLGRGLAVSDGTIRESLFDLPVTQPPDRTGWLNTDFFSSTGHPVNRAGVETDDRFRPLDTNGAVAHPRLYACGSILAHQDWKREKSGAGISIASAFKAVSDLADGSGGDSISGDQAEACKM